MYVPKGSHSAQANGREKVLVISSKLVLNEWRSTSKTSWGNNNQISPEHQVDQTCQLWPTLFLIIVTMTERNQGYLFMKCPSRFHEFSSENPRLANIYILFSILLVKWTIFVKLIPIRLLLFNKKSSHKCCEIHHILRFSYSVATYRIIGFLGVEVWDFVKLWREEVKELKIECYRIHTDD